MKNPKYIFYVDCTAASEIGIIQRAAVETDLLSAMRRAESCIAHKGNEIYLFRIFQRTSEGYVCAAVARMNGWQAYGFKGWITSPEDNDFDNLTYHWTPLRDRDGVLERVYPS